MRIVYGKATKGRVPTGAEISEGPVEGWDRILVGKSDVLTLEKSYLLEEKMPLESLGTVPTDGGYRFLMRDADHEVTEYPSGRIEVRNRTDWIRKSVMAKEGKIVELGETLAVVQITRGLYKTMQKSELHRYTEADIIRREFRKSEVSRALQSARRDVEKEPTDAQIEAGNYRKGHVNIQGFDITIENPKGGTRRGTDKHGKPWEVTMKNDYGYIKSTEDKDGENTDVFIGEHPESQKVFVVDQVDPESGKFDEHKTVLGALDEEEAKKTYLQNYEKDWKGLGKISPMSVDEFKEWLKNGNTKKPVSKIIKSLFRFTNLFKARVLSQQEAGMLPKLFTQNMKVEGQNWNEGDAHEGDTRSFGENDMRTLARTPAGVLRWMNADEYQKNQQELQEKGMKHAGEGVNPHSEFNKKIRESLRIGEKIVAGKVQGRVAETGDTLAVIDTGKGKKETVPLHSIVVHKETEEEQDKAYAEKEKKQEEQRRAKAQTIEQMKQETPEYKAFSAQADKDGFRYETPYEFSAHQVLHMGNEEQAEGVTNESFVRRIYDPEQKKWIATIDGKGAKVKAGDNSYELIGYKGSMLQVRNSQTGEIGEIHPLEMDTVKGSLAMDEEGNLYVDSGGEHHKIESGAVSNEDLMKPGFIGVINGKVWKAMQAGDAGVYHDVFVGKIGERGVIEYQDENQMAMRGKRGMTRVDKDHFARDHEPRADETELSKNQKRARKRQEKVKANTARVNDVSMAKSAAEALSTQPERENLSTYNYQNSIDDYLGKADEIISGLANKFGMPEWNASVDRLAQTMKAYDEAKNADVAQLNAENKTGIKLIPRKIHTYDSYRDAANRALMDARSEYNRKRLAEKIKEHQEGGAKEKFEWDQPAEKINPEYLATPDRLMKIRDSKDNEYYVYDAIVPMSKVVGSHNVEGNPNPDHPEELQARLREGAASVLQMKKIKEGVDDRIIQDSADATRGSSVAYPQNGLFYIAQGNARNGGVQATEGEQREKYNGLLKRKASLMGKDPGKVENGFMHIRVMAPMHTYGDARRLASYGQESSAMPMTDVEKARQFKMGQKERFTFDKINTSGIGARPIDESNVHTFIKDNPQLYEKIVKDGGYDRVAVESDPEFQASVINTALLSQLEPEFLNQAAKMDRSGQNLIRRLAPVLALNQKEVAAGSLPKWVDLQDVVGSTFRLYRNLDARTKDLMSNRNGTMGFLNPDEHSGDPNTLLHRMRQEELGNTMGRDAKAFRNPLSMIALLAYHQAANSRLGEENAGKAATAFALKIRRFQDALRQIGDDKQENLFGAMMTPEEKEAERRDKILEAAETTMLRNRTYAADSQTLTPEEQAVGNEEVVNGGVLDVMRKAKKLYGINWTTDEATAPSVDAGTISKSMLGRFFKRKDLREFDRDKEEMRDFFLNMVKSELQMMGGAKPEDEVKKEEIPGGIRFVFPKKVQRPSFAQATLTVGESVSDQYGNLAGKIVDIAGDTVTVENEQGNKRTYKATELNPVAETDEDNVAG